MKVKKPLCLICFKTADQVRGQTAQAGEHVCNYGTPDETIFHFCTPCQKQTHHDGNMCLECDARRKKILDYVKHKQRGKATKEAIATIPEYECGQCGATPSNPKKLSETEASVRLDGKTQTVELRYCQYCVQMTNHDGKGCMKCEWRRKRILKKLDNGEDSAGNDLVGCSEMSPDGPSNEDLVTAPSKPNQCPKCNAPDFASEYEGQTISACEKCGYNPYRTKQEEPCIKCGKPNDPECSETHVVLYGHDFEGKSKCCRQSLDCGGPLLNIADGGGQLCLKCIQKIPPSRTSEQVLEWMKKQKNHLLMNTNESQISSSILEQESARRQMHVEVSNWLDRYSTLPKGVGNSIGHKQGIMIEGLATEWNLTRRTEYTLEILRGIAAKMK